MYNKIKRIFFFFWGLIIENFCLIIVCCCSFVFTSSSKFEEKSFFFVFNLLRIKSYASFDGVVDNGSKCANARVVVVVIGFVTKIFQEQ